MPPKAPRVSECEAGGLLRVKRADLVKMVRALKAEPDLERIVKARKTKDFNRKPTRAELCAAINARRKSMSRRKYLLLLGPALVAAVLGAAVWRREILGLLPTSTRQAETILGGVSEMADHIRQIVPIPKYEPTTKAGAYMQAHPPHQLEPARAREIMRTVATLERERKQTLQRTAAIDMQILRTQQQQRKTQRTEEQRRAREAETAKLTLQRQEQARRAALYKATIEQAKTNAAIEVRAAEQARRYKTETYDTPPGTMQFYDRVPKETATGYSSRKPPAPLPASTYGKAPVRRRDQKLPLTRYDILPVKPPYAAPPIVSNYDPNVAAASSTQAQFFHYQTPQQAASSGYEKLGEGRRPNSPFTAGYVSSSGAEASKSSSAPISSSFKPPYEKAPSYSEAPYDVVPSNPTTIGQRKSDNYTIMSRDDPQNVRYTSLSPSAIPQVEGRRAATLPAPLASQYRSLPGSSTQYGALPTQQSAKTYQAAGRSSTAPAGKMQRGQAVASNTRVDLYGSPLAAVQTGRAGLKKSGDYVAIPAPPLQTNREDLVAARRRLKPVAKQSSGRLSGYGQLPGEF